jgi:PAS domain S-box-containing protein
MHASLRREYETDRRRFRKTRRIEALFRAIPDAVVGFSADGRIDGYNPSLLSLLGWDKDIAAGATHLDVARALLARDESNDRAEKERHVAALLRGDSDECAVVETFRMEVPETVAYELRIERRMDAPAETIALIRNVTAHTTVRDSERDLNATLRAIGDAVIVTDDQGRVKRLNPAAEDLVGCRQHDVIDKHYLDVFSVRNIATGENAPLPLNEVMKSGQLLRLAEVRSLVTRHDECEISISMAPLRQVTGDVHGVVMVLRDVSRQYQSDEALVRSEARYRQLIAQLPYGVILGQHGAIRFANQKALEMLGARGAMEVLGKCPHDFLDPEYIPIVEERILRIQKYGEVAPTLEERWMRLDGSSFSCEVTAVPHDIEGEPGAIIMLNDITERKKAEADRDRFFDLSLDLIALAEPNGYFRRVNPAFTKVLGWLREELIGRPFIGFVHPDDREATLGELQRGLSRPIDCFENRYLCRDGSIRWLAWKAVLIDGLVYANKHDLPQKMPLDIRAPF